VFVGTNLGPVGAAGQGSPLWPGELCEYGGQELKRY
jgi:hypothetical protein